MVGGGRGGGKGVVGGGRGGGKGVVGGGRGGGKGVVGRGRGGGKGSNVFVVQYIGLASSTAGGWMLRNSILTIFSVTCSV